MTASTGRAWSAARRSLLLGCVHYRKFRPACVARTAWSGVAASSSSSPSRSRPAPTTNRQPTRDCITGPGAIPAPFFCRGYAIDRGAPRLRRGAPNVGGCGGPSRGPPRFVGPIFYSVAGGFQAALHGCNLLGTGCLQRQLDLCLADRGVRRERAVVEDLQYIGALL